MPGIDGLRAVAVAAVFLYHANLSWMPGGFLGVDVFFVISGYLITSLLIAEFEDRGRIALGRFWAGRARRLLPALFALLAVCLAIGATLQRGKLIGLRGDALASIFYVANWRFIFSHESYFAQFGRPSLLRHLWSLAVEEQFYLLWPPLFLIGMRLLRRATLAALVALGAIGSTALMWALYRPGADTSRIFYGTDTRAAPLLIGVLLAFAWKPSAMPAWDSARARRRLDALSVVALAAVIYAFVTVHDYDQSIYRGGFLALALSAGLLLATIVHPASTLGHALARPVPRWLGERSYGIYLWHWPVLVFSRPGVDVHLPRGVLIPAQAAATVVLAAVSYRYIERPIRTGALQRLRVRAPRWLAQPRTPFAFACGGAGALLALVALTPQGVAALPPGFTRSALASSEHASTHLVALESTLGPELRIDAVVSRQPEQTIARLFAYRAAGTLPPRVIVHIGDNGPVYYADLLRLKAALAGVPLVVIVNVRVATSWQSEVNSELGQAVAGWHEATIADWYDASAGGGAVADGTHTTTAGAELFAALIVRALHAPRLGGVTH